MGGHRLDGNAQCRGLSAESLGADPQSVDALQQFLFQCSIIRVGIWLVQRTEQRLFGKGRHFVEASSDTDAQHDGRTRVGTSDLHGLIDEILYALHAVCRFQHGQAAHVLTAKALGCHCDLQPVARYQMHGDGCRSIVPGVAAAERICHDALSQIPFLISPADPFMDGFIDVTLHMYILSQFQKHTCHSGILAHRKFPFLGKRHVLLEDIQRIFCRGPADSMAFTMSSGS